MPTAHILIVEDHRDTAEILADILTDEGFVVTTVGSCAEARAVAAGRVFDLLIADLGLPDCDGCELCKELRASSAVKKAIAFTADGYQADVDRCREAGFDTHILKPADLKTIRATIRQLLGR